MSNHMMFWRSTGLELSIRKNTATAACGRNQDRHHLACSDHSPAELAAFERSLHRTGGSPWQPARATKH